MRPPASPRRQRGMGMFGWLTIALMAGTIGLVGLRVMPVYINYFHVLDVAKAMASEPGLVSKGKSELKGIVAQRFRQNNLYDMSPTVLKFAKSTAQKLIVHIDYEVRVPMFGNLDIVATFDKKIFGL